MPPYVKLVGGALDTYTFACQYTNPNNYAVGHVQQNDNTYDLAVGIGYTDGPTDYVNMKVGTREFQVPKGSALAFVFDKSTPVCTQLRHDPVSIHYLQPGTYTMQLLAGYTDRQTFYVTDYWQTDVKVDQPQPTPTPTPTPTPSPSPPPGAPQIPMEWLILFMFFLLAIVVVVVAVRR